MPMSAIWCWAQLDEQPAKCRRKSSPWPFGVTCVSRNAAISAARPPSGPFVWTLARPQNSLPVHVCSARLKNVGCGLELLRERLGQQLVDALVRDPRQQHVLLVGQADLGRRAVLAGQADELEQLGGLQAADRDAEADRRVLAVGLRRDADVVVAAKVRLGPRRGRSSPAHAAHELLAEGLGAHRVDEELEAGAAALGAVLLAVAEDRGDARDDLRDLLRRDEDVEARAKCGLLEDRLRRGG